VTVELGIVSEEPRRGRIFRTHFACDNSIMPHLHSASAARSRLPSRSRLVHTISLLRPKTIIHSIPQSWEVPISKSSRCPSCDPSNPSCTNPPPSSACTSCFPSAGCTTLAQTSKSASPYPTSGPRRTRPITFPLRRTRSSLNLPDCAPVVLPPAKGESSWRATMSPLSSTPSPPLVLSSSR
jgi:hypothetical protein